MNLHRLLFSSALVQGVGLILTMLLGVELARYLGPTEYGVYGLIMAVVSIAAVVGQFGLPLLGTREAARPNVDLRELVRWFIPRAAIISSLVAIVLAGALLALDPPWLGKQQPIILAAVFAALSALLATSVAILRGAGQNLTGQIIDLLFRPALIVAAVFGLNLFMGLDVETALGAQVATVAACLGLSVALLWRRAGIGAGSAKRFEVSGWLATSSTYMANALLGALNASYPMIVAGLFVSGPDLGILRVAIASAVFLSLPSAIANIATIPIVAREHAAGDIQGLARTLSHTTLACFVLTAGGWLFLFLLGKPAIVLLFGSEYADAYLSLLTLGAAQLVIAAFGISGSYLNLSSRERLVTHAFLVSVPTAIIASIILTSAFGIMGAAIGVVVMAVIWHGYIFGVHRCEIDVPLSIFAALKHVRAERGTRH